MSKAKAKNRKQKKATPAAKQPDVSRRNVLKLAAYGSGAAVAVGAVGVWSVAGVRATAAEHDLTRLGQGQIAVVQVHDPTCPRCNELQREVRKTLECMGGDAPLYLVASIKTQLGSAFALQHGLPHVTLAFMDAEGRMIRSLSGVRSSEELKPIFQTHVAIA